MDNAVYELRKAFHRVRARTLRRFKTSRRNITWEDYELSAYKYLETEPQKQSNREQQAAELMQEILDLLRKTWKFLVLALECLSVRDRTLFYQVYGLGQLPASPEDLTSLTRNARNVALYRARQRFLKSLWRVLTDALREGACDEPAVLEELLNMIESGSFKALLAFRRQPH
ncbi:MAG TPA: hypothetical protein VN493_22550 [Thermoanaerobaculia bacterium]|nr:hypothetical protein [Thermoanaerobaculia bacterium]